MPRSLARLLVICSTAACAVDDVELRTLGRQNDAQGRRAEPLATDAAWGTDSDGVNAGHGGAIGSAGDVNGDGWEDVYVAAATWSNGQASEGRVQVYLGAGTGLPATPAWSAEANAANALFGSSVTAGDVNGDGFGDLIVGAPWHSNGQLREGRVSVYLGSPAGLGASATWTVEANVANQNLGTSVGSADVNGDGYTDVLVGAPYYTNGQAGEGRVLVYHGSGSGPGASPAWSVEGNSASALLGFSVSSAGDVNADGYDDVVLGAPTYTGSAAAQGRALLFQGSATGLGASPAWSAEGPAADAFFGGVVRGVGDVDGDGYAEVAVGASSVNSAEGGAWLYGGGSGGLGASPVWSYTPALAAGQFGGAIAPPGDVNGDGYADLFVAAYNADSSSGRVFAFFGGAGGASTDPDWTADGESADWFGKALGLVDADGDGFGDLLVGAPHAYDDEPGEGRAFLFRGGAASLAEAPDEEIAGSLVSATGAAVALVGDVDGDGYGDLAVGAPGATGAGSLFLYGGGAVGLDTSSPATRDGEETADAFGTALGAAGDVNGDGYADVVVAGRFAFGDPGAAYLYVGGPGGLGAAATWTATGTTAGDDFGRSVAGVGDVDGDGYDDLLVGAPSESVSATHAGAAYLYRGGAAGPSASADWAVQGQDPGEALGSTVGAAGDVNGDGYADALIVDRRGVGRTLVFFGSTAGLGQSPDWSMEDPDGSASSPSAGRAGDLNGDGFADLAVGNAGARAHGTVHVYFGSAAGPSPAPDWTLEAGAADGFDGHVAGAGDVNGDGYGDLLIGYASADGGGRQRGRIDLHLGGPTGPSTTADWSWVGTEDGGQLGSVLAGGGDLNGDGLAEVFAGLPFAAGLDGAVVGFYGGGAEGIGLGTGQLLRASGGATPVAPGGIVPTPDGFDVTLPDARLPRGRAVARLEVEVKRLGEAFDGASVQAGAWTGLGATEVSASVTGLEAGSGYHWRARLVASPRHGDGQAAGSWRWGGRTGDPLGGHVFTEGAQSPIYADADLDGYGDATTSFVPRGGTSPSGYVADGTDCDDVHTAVNPGATEICNGTDDDCDLTTDEEGALGGEDYFVDADQDGWGGAETVFACAASPGYSHVDGDCHDGDPAVNPDADEFCNEVDDDCDGLVDPPTAVDAGLWYRDNDGDGHGVSRGNVLSCDQPPGMVTNTSDCDDTRSSVYPGADEYCNDMDDDCDGVVDPATAEDAVLWYRDRDGDGFGGTRRPALSCEAPPGHTALSTDCNDAASTVYPGAPERCNNVDDDCDGTSDEPGDEIQPGWYTDADGDGYGAGEVARACTAPASSSPSDGDCDDQERWVYPGAGEICDGQANDCDVAAGWSPSDEDGLVTLFALDGSSVTDWTTTFAAGTPSAAVAVTLPAQGTLLLCDGAWYAMMTASNPGSLTIMGLGGAGGSVVSAADSGRVLDVTGSGVSLTVEGLRLVDGAAPGGNGGAVRVSAGALTLRDSELGSSSAELGAGVYQSGGTLNLDGVLISDNAATSGGGVYVYGGTFGLDDSEISSNTATDGAGLFLRSGTFRVSGAHVLDNVASGTGGGLRVGARVTLADSVIEGNSANQGGGVYFSPATVTLQLTDTEVSGNSASTFGGGVYSASSGTVACTGQAGEVGGFLGNAAGTGGGGVYLANSAGRLQASVCDFGDAALTNNSPNDIRFGTNTYDRGDDQTFTCSAGICP